MENEEITQSSGNVFADLDLPNPEDHMLKAQLANEIQHLISRRGWTQARIGEVIGLDQANVSRLLRGRLADFSIDRLLKILNRLGHDVEVRISAEERLPEHARTRVLVA